MSIRSTVCALSVAAACLLAAPLAAQSFAIDFGDDSGDYPNDGECEDARFIGRGMAQTLLTDDIGRDASDCRKLLRDGSIALNRLFVRPATPNDIIFGDDASEYARDGECDDIRFVGAESEEAIFLYEDVGHDATDCKAGFDAGTLRWQGDSARPELGITADEIMG